MLDLFSEGHSMREPVPLENGIIASRFIGSDAAMGLRNGPSKIVPAQTHRSTVVSRGARVEKHPFVLQER
jgi:hypothetical protein